ncbi:MAG: phosphotriesterase [Candidatus Latescibacteria bacterium]|jgi:predicted metal-dependent phosphotriesterase family hydrolase|nr:phosphotriesterase [Candidatus Latescibacterota bacterium]MBT5829097.1 phosphotriesterase [Candidatus Latescibacterota bacterium]
MITRRTFIQNSLLTLGALATGPSLYAQSNPKVMTVTGLISSEKIGFTLPHEHVMSIFGGPIAQHAKYNEEELFGIVIPYLKKLKGMGLTTLCDCTTAYFGRRADLLKTISLETGVQILTNTGHYGAAKDKYVPEHAKIESVDQLTKRWISDWENGIDGTDIRPGFIKIGVDNGTLSPIDLKLVRAAAQTHLHSGLTIAAHTSGSTDAAFDQLQALKEEGVHASAWVWVHAHNVKENDALLYAAKAGAWIEFDGIKESSLDRHIELVNLMKKHGHLDQVLLSHDGNSFRYGDRPFKPYASIFTHFVPRLKEAGYTNKEIVQLTVINPRNAFAIQVRKA